MATPQFDFDGQRPWESLGVRRQSPEPGIVAKADDLTAGGSGGPWFVGDDLTVVNGVFSSYSTAQRTVRSPEFGPWVLTFFHHVFG